ncbi:MAG: Ig-like domain-containing protein [Parvibaculaceae bacterium]|nr:Ig-like domain-containing protein [Parvibaculaceae bacterium]
MRSALIAIGIIIILVLAFLTGQHYGLFRLGEAPAGAPAASSATEPGASPNAPAPGVPTFDVVRVDKDGSVVMAGRGEPGAEISILANGAVVATVKADQNGEWVVNLDKPLAAGATQLTLSAKNPDGSTKVSTQLVAVNIPSKAGEETTVALSEPGKATRVLQGPGLQASAGSSVVLQAVDYDGKGNVIFSGKARPGTVVALSIDGKEVGRTIADADGHWEVKPEGSISVGQHSLKVEELNAAGAVVGVIEVPLQREDPAKAVAGLKAGQVVIQPGNNLWNISRKLYGEGTQYTVIYEANKDQIKDPDLIYPGQVFTTPQTKP